MMRILKTFGLTLGAVLALGAGLTSMASAESIGQETAAFTSNLGAAETGKLDAEQTVSGKDRFTVNGLSLTCMTAKLNGIAPEPGPSVHTFNATPTYEECHVVIAGLTKLVTVTTNGCEYQFHAVTTLTKNTATSSDPAVTVTLICPVGQKLEIHVYTKAASEAETQCTYDVTPGDLGTIVFDNVAGSPDHLLATPNLTFNVHNTIKSAVCGPNEIESSKYTGEDTVRATSEAGGFVNLTISDTPI